MSRTITEVITCISLCPENVLSGTGKRRLVDVGREKSTSLQHFSGFQNHSDYVRWTGRQPDIPHRTSAHLQPFFAGGLTLTDRINATSSMVNIAGHDDDKTFPIPPSQQIWAIWNESAKGFLAPNEHLSEKAECQRKNPCQNNRIEEWEFKKDRQEEEW